VSAIARSLRQSPAPTHGPSLAPFGRRFEYPDGEIHPDVIVMSSKYRP